MDVSFVDGSTMALPHRRQPIPPNGTPVSEALYALFSDIAS